MTAVAYHDGRLDGIGIWKRVLTAQERTELYHGGVGLQYPFVFNMSGHVPVQVGPIQSLGII